MAILQSNNLQKTNELLQTNETQLPDEAETNPNPDEGDDEE